LADEIVAAADVVSVVVRALSFVAIFQAAGMAMFIALFGRDTGASAAALRRICSASVWIALLSVLLHYALEAARMGGELASALDPSLQSIVLHSSASIAMGLRVLGLIVLLIGLRLFKAGVALSGVALVFLGFTAVGHTTTHSPRVLLAALLLVHLIIGAFWFGALVPLYLVVSRESSTTAARVVERFSAIAVGLVPVLFVAGVLLAIALLPNFAALATSYGRLLIVKVLGFSVLMVFAALNKWRLGPALVHGDIRSSQAFRRSVAAEYVLLVAVLSVTATLTALYSPDAG
jgi:putative copper export protein